MMDGNGGEIPTGLTVAQKSSVDCEPSPEAFGIIGRSPALMAAWALAVRASRGAMNVHLEGETGTGKELFAIALHQLSRRAKNPFIAINCATLNSELATSELFGHRKGAFTGAISDRRGTFEDAAGGTLFLDEVSELRLETQAKLLRVLESRCFRRIGETAETKADVRIVSASNLGLRKLVQDGKFREDLFQRLCCFEIRLPPLRERRSDIVEIAVELLGKMQEGKGASFSDAARKKLTELPWGGNVRELKNVVERTKILSATHEISADLVNPIAVLRPSVTRPYREVEVDCFRAAIDQCNGNIRATALLLELSYSTVRSKLIRFGLDGYARQKREASRVKEKPKRLGTRSNTEVTPRE